MLTDKEILQKIRASVQEIVPDAKVFLFGSRARGDWHDESDWDILVLTENEVGRNLKNKLHQNLYSVSCEIGGYFINSIVVQEADWFNNAAYYALRLNVEPEKISV